MKRFKLFILIMALGMVGSVVTSCGSGNADSTEQQGKEYTSAYICPMHCDGSGSEEPGKCPVCGMDYVKNENTKG